MILMGAGVNHWFHSDQIYRAMLVLTTITGCQGRNGGGWAHYVGQEKIRPIMGFQHMAFALDWHRPPRHMNQTAYWYVNTSQYRYDTFTADDLDAGNGHLRRETVMDLLAQSVRLGWTPSYPTFNRSRLALADDAEEAGQAAPAIRREELKSGELRFAVEDPEAEDNHPRILSCGAPTCSAPRPRATSTSCVTCSAPTARRPRWRRHPRCGRRTSCGPTRRPRGAWTCSPRSTSG